MKATGAFTVSLWLTFNTTFFRATRMRHMSRPLFCAVLLINPFYRKDPQGSFGKHVLTPTLALTSIAAATPPDWEIQYWDENLLQGHPPFEPFPSKVQRLHKAQRPAFFIHIFSGDL